MSKSVQNVKNSLKFKANVKEGILTVRVGVKKWVLPISARILSSDGHLFLSIPATSELYAVKGGKLVAMGDGDDASAAFAALNPTKKKSSRKKSAPAELPSELKSALSAIPAGYKLAFDASGSPRLVKTRKRRKSSAKG